MNLDLLNRVCYIVSLACIMAGVVLAIVMIWGDLRDEMVWRSMMTVGVLFLASALTLSINRMMARPGK